MWHQRQTNKTYGNEDLEIHTWTTDFLQRCKGNSVEKESSVQQMVLKELDIHIYHIQKLAQNVSQT